VHWASESAGCNSEVTVPVPPGEWTLDKTSATTCDNPGVCVASGGNESCANSSAISRAMMPIAGLFEGGRSLTNKVSDPTLSPTRLRMMRSRAHKCAHSLINSD